MMEGEWAFEYLKRETLQRDLLGVFVVIGGKKYACGISASGDNIHSLISSLESMKQQLLDIIEANK